jgi:hypothetical protein
MSSVRKVRIIANIKKFLLQYDYHLMFKNVVVKDTYTIKRL